MKVLVTGGTGFVGSHSVRALLAKGHQVKLLARNPKRVEMKDVDVAAGDVTDRAAVAKAVAGCDAVLHCASIYSLEARKNAEMLRVNVGGTRNVLEAGVAAAPVFQLIAAAGAHLPNSAEGAYLTWRDHPVGNGASSAFAFGRWRIPCATPWPGANRQAIWPPSTARLGFFG
jgi:nucleoside-diphosphate-sugar epimerase